MSRIDELKNRMLRADNSGAGKASKERDSKELLSIAKRLEDFADKKPLSKVARIVRSKATEIRSFVAQS